MYETVVPPLEERDFEKTVTPIVQEYFEHADANEVAVSVVVLYFAFVLLTTDGLVSSLIKGGTKMVTLIASQCKPV